MSILLLAIETTCDETGAAVLEGDSTGVPTIRSSVVASQIDLHRRFGGVVPEIAARAHVRQILPVDRRGPQAGGGRARRDRGRRRGSTRPGLVGALIVGLTAAKALALALDVPLIAVDHLEGHLYACQLAFPGRDVYPVRRPGRVGRPHEPLRLPRAARCRAARRARSTTPRARPSTRSPASSGSAIPADPAIERAAKAGNPRAHAFPRSFLRDERLAFSFSGLKTAVLYALKGQDARGGSGPAAGGGSWRTWRRVSRRRWSTSSIAKALQALRQTGMRRLGIGGGRRRERPVPRAGCEAAAGEGTGSSYSSRPLALCTDNAAMAGDRPDQARCGAGVRPGYRRHAPGWSGRGVRMSDENAPADFPPGQIRAHNNME